MLTQKPPTTELSNDPHARKKGARPQDDTVCWFEGQWTPLADAKVSVMTHSFLYGTAVFEGIRAYWNADDEQLYLLKAREHFERIVDSSKILMMDPGYSVDEMVALTIELLRRNAYREDCYVRATTYKSDEAIGVKLHDLQSRLNLSPSPSVTTSPRTDPSPAARSPGGARVTSPSPRGPRSWAPTSTRPSPRRRPC